MVTWTPSAEYYGQTVDVVLEVRDSNYPPGIGTQTYSIQVNEAPGNNDPYFANDPEITHVLPAGVPESNDDVSPLLLNLGIADGQTWHIDEAGARYTQKNATRLADVVFLLDGSGSMDAGFGWLANDDNVDDDPGPDGVVHTLLDELTDRGFSDVNFGLTIFGAADLAIPQPIHASDPNGEADTYMGSAAELVSALKSLEPLDDAVCYEDGYAAMEDLLQDTKDPSQSLYGFRDNAQVCFVLITDEGRDSLHDEGITPVDPYADEHPQDYPGLDFEAMLHGKEPDTENEKHLLGLFRDADKCAGQHPAACCS